MEPTTVVRVAARGVLNTPPLRLPGTCKTSITYLTPGGWRLAHRTGDPSAPINQAHDSLLLRVEAIRHGLGMTSSSCAVFETEDLKEGAMIPLLRHERRSGYIVVRRICSEFGLTELVFDVFIYASCGKDEMALVMKDSPYLGIEAEELVKVGRRGIRVSKGVGLMSFVRWLRGGEKVRQEAALNVLGNVNGRYTTQGRLVKETP